MMRFCHSLLLLAASLSMFAASFFMFAASFFMFAACRHNRVVNFYNDTKDYGFISIPTGNHDIPRISIQRDIDEIEMVFAFMLTMPGVPFIYYGDEIGMKNLNLVSKEGGYNRTGARTPMQWNHGRNLGFSSAESERLYLPVDSRVDAPTVEAQERDESSLLNRVKRLIALRQQHKSLAANGAFTPVHAQANEYPFVYERKLDGERFLIAFNPSSRPVEIILSVEGLPKASKLVMGRGAKIAENKLSMQGASYGIWEL